MRTIQPILLAILLIVSNFSAFAQTENAVKSEDVINPTSAQKWTEHFKAVHPNEEFILDKKAVKDLIAPTYVKGLYLVKGLYNQKVELLAYRADADGNILDRSLTDPECPNPPSCVEMIASYNAMNPNSGNGQFVKKEVFTSILDKVETNGIKVIASSKHSYLVEGMFVKSTMSGELFSTDYMQDILASNDVAGLYIYKSTLYNREKLLIYRANAAGSIIDRSFTDVGCPVPPNCKDMIDKYQAEHPGALKAQLFEKKAFNSLLSNASTKGIFIMNAIDDQNQEKFVLAGVDSKGEIIWNTAIGNGKTSASDHTEDTYISKTSK
jgi:hypothetical protein